MTKSFVDFFDVLRSPWCPLSVGTKIIPIASQKVHFWWPNIIFPIFFRFFSGGLVFFHFLRCDWNNFGSYGKVTVRAFQNIKKIKKRLSHRWEIFDWVEDFAKKVSNLYAGMTFGLYYCINPFANPLRFVCWRSPALSWRFLIDD